MDLAVFDWMRENSHGRDELTNVMMVSGDNLCFKRLLQRCKKDLNMNILLAQPQDSPRRCSGCTTPLSEITTAEWIWESLSAGGDPITTTTAAS